MRHPLDGDMEMDAEERERLLSGSYYFLLRTPIPTKLWLAAI